MKSLLNVFIVSSFCVFTSYVHASTQLTPANYLDQIKHQPVLLASYIKDFPKGGDLHVHLSGTPYAENLLRYAHGEQYCINRTTFTVYRDGHCKGSLLLDNAIKDEEFYNKLIDAWSMRNFNKSMQNSTENGHDHFFATFGKYSLISHEHRAEILAEAIQRASDQNSSYLEIMDTLDKNASGQLGKQLGWDPDFDKMRERLLANNFSQIIDSVVTNLNEDDANVQALLHCKTNHPKQACAVKFRYLYQVLREQPPEQIFAQLLAGFESARRDKRVVGLNIVQPEDGNISMRDYALQMQMFAYFHALYPDVKTSLHAGELSEVIVPPEGLKSHIHDAVTLAKADRIGHGVDIASEDYSDQTLTEMATRHVLVEINLSSNYFILGSTPANHPLPLYLQSNVPVALSTDDEGVARTDLSQEYLHAIVNFDLEYPTMKQFSRNSLTYSFLPGNSLWVTDEQVVDACAQDKLGSQQPSEACTQFLTLNEKAAMQWDLEKRFSEFEERARG